MPAIQLTPAQTLAALDGLSFAIADALSLARRSRPGSSQHYRAAGQAARWAVLEGMLREQAEGAWGAGWEAEAMLG